MIAGIAVRQFFPRIPYMIVAILVGSLLAVGLKEWAGIAVPSIGALPSSLPPLSLPSFDPQVWRNLAPTALAVTLFALTEALSISRALAVRSGQHIDGNQEFIGQGLSNIAGSFFSGYVATGSFNRSGLNYEAGAKTPLAAIIAGSALAVIVLAVAPLAAYMPNGAMAGVLFIVAWGLIDRHHIRQIFKTSRSETAVLVVTFLSTLLVDLEIAILSGVLLSLVLYLNRTSHPGIHIRVPDPDSSSRKFTSAGDLRECPQLRIIRIDGSLFFGAVNYFQETMRAYENEAPNRKFLAIFMSGVNFLDIAGAEALTQEAKKLRERGGGLYMVRVKEAVLDRLERGGYLDEIGRKNVFQSKTQALRAIYAKFDYDRCRACGLRVFVECGRMGLKEPDELISPNSCSC
jgi:SulP family sulfate permease